MTHFSDELRTHHVYEMWADDHCLYIGMTANLPRRLREHSRKPWAGEVVRVEVTERPTGRSASRLERELIAEHMPTHNRMGKPYMWLPLTARPT